MEKEFYSFNKSKSTFFLFLFFVFSYQAYAQNIYIYVAPNGAPTGNGNVQNAPVSLAQAKAVAKANPQKSCFIYLASGIYPALTLDATDSRSAAYPVVYTSIVPYGAIFQPEISLTSTNFTPIPDIIKARIINATAKTKVMQMSLASMNLRDTAQWPQTFSLFKLKTPKFYRNGVPLPLYRYPADSSSMTMRQVVNRGSVNSVPGGSFKYRDGRGKYWLNAINDGGLFLSGNWQTPWLIDVIKTQSLSMVDSLVVQAIGISGGIGTLAPTRLAAGTEPYTALNLVEEIAAEGQWSINFKTKMLYMWVPASGTLTCSGNSKTPAISITGVSNTSFTGIAVRGGSGNGIELHNSSNIIIPGTQISYCSGYGETLRLGTNCQVQSNDIDSVGAGGVIISSST